MQQNVQIKAPTRRWMKSVVAASAEGLPRLPWQRATNRVAEQRASEAVKSHALRAVAAR